MPPQTTDHRRDLTTRAFALRSDSYSATTRSVEAVLATENMVRVFDMNTWEIIDEVLRMDGLTLPAAGQVPMLDTHDRSTIKKQLGSTRELRIESGQLVGRRFFADTTDAKEAESQVRDGHVTDGSIGYAVTNAVRIEPGKSAEVSGITYTANPELPLRVALAWEVREDSLCPIGADAAAKVRANQESQTMPPTKTTPTKTTPTPAKPGEPQQSEAVRAEQERTGLIRSLGEDVKIPEATIRAAILDGSTIEAARATFREVMAEQMDQHVPFAHTPAVQVGENRAAADLATGISDAILMRVGVPLIREVARQPVVDTAGRPEIREPNPRANSFASMSLAEIARGYLQAQGGQPEGKSRREIVREAMNHRADFSTVSLPNILGDTIGRTLRAAYAESKPIWPAFCRMRTGKDFRDMTRLDFGAIEELDLVAPGGEYTHATLSEKKIAYRLAKYGKMIALTWEAIVNDDLRAFDAIPRKLAAAAIRKEDALAVACIVANGDMNDEVACFHADHSNLATGGDACAPSVAAFNAARLAMRLQRDINADADSYLNISPRVWMGPAALEASVEELVKSPIKPVDPTDTAAVAIPNAWHGKLKMAVHPAFDADDSGRWYLSAGADSDSVEMCFLDGHRHPTVETERFFETDGIRWKVRHCLAAAIVDERPLYRNDG